ncbi:MAG: hypothetical protein ABIQ75_04050 [Flavobacteriales bacterium]
MRARSTVSLLLLFASLHVLAQQLPFDMSVAGDRYNNLCRACLSAMRDKPKEVQLGLFADERGDVWFTISDERFFNTLFTGPGDGISVDVIPRSLYGCTKPPVKSDYFKGTALDPVYLDALKKSMRKTNTGPILMKAGHVPEELRKQPFELALVLLKDKYFCYYNGFYNLRSYRWDLLDMGLYLDSLTYHDATDTAINVLRSDKVMRFTIPFAKNKAEYSAKDLAPLRDSLRLTDFTIYAIDIHAYSSVEGSEAHNIELQKQRAASILRAMQSYQRPGIATTTEANENWVEFLNDVGSSPYPDLAGLSKEDVKARLRDPAVLQRLEPMLARHRKALVTVYLRKNSAFTNADTTQLVSDLQKALEDGDPQRASEVQRAMFRRIADHAAPNSLLDRVEIPRKKEFLLLLDQHATLNYFLDPSTALASYRELEALDKEFPNDVHLRYNLCALKFRVWKDGTLDVNADDFLRQINALKYLGIPEPLVRRMQVNHRIILADRHMREGRYSQKDEDLKFVEANYPRLALTDKDLLSLAQYFASYGDYVKARALIEPRLTHINVSEDLLFYYLNLTLTDAATTAKPAYRKVMLNAINSDRRRFCDLFEPFGKGITFQLLDDPYLKKTWCEECQR